MSAVTKVHGVIAETPCLDTALDVTFEDVAADITSAAAAEKRQDATHPTPLSPLLSEH